MCMYAETEGEARVKLTKAIVEKSADIFYEAGALHFQSEIAMAKLRKAQRYILLV
jgi:hypothetical protein